MRVWRHRSAHLLERPAELRVLASLLTLTGRAWKEPPADYQLVDDGGAVQARFIAVTWADEDDVGATLFVVEHGALVQLDVRSGPRGESCAEKVVLDGLAAAPDRPDEPPPPPPYRTRLDNIHGALHQHGHGAVFARAQERLGARLAAYGEPCCEALLRALLALGTIYEESSLPALRLALGELTRAARYATFDAAVYNSESSDASGDIDAGPSADVAGLDARARDAVRTLIGALRELERKLELEGDTQEDVDAHGNAAFLYRASSSVGRARAALERELSSAGS